MCVLSNHITVISECQHMLLVGRLTFRLKINFILCRSVFEMIQFVFYLFWGILVVIPCITSHCLKRTKAKFLVVNVGKLFSGLMKYFTETYLRFACWVILHPFLFSDTFFEIFCLPCSGYKLFAKVISRQHY